MGRGARLMLALAGLAVLIGARPLAAEPVDAFVGVRVGTPLAEVLAAQPSARIWQQTKTELDGCYFQYSIPTTLAALPAEAWLCERRDHPEKIVTAISVEVWTDQAGYLRVVEAVTTRYGLPHHFWGNCTNAAGRKTEQYSWYFGAAYVRLINRDLMNGWLVLRIDEPSITADYGPGNCFTPPMELRIEEAPADD